MDQLTYKRRKNALGETEYAAETTTHRYLVRRDRDLRGAWLAEVWTLRAVGITDPVMVRGQLVTTLDYNFSRAQAYDDAQQWADRYATTQTQGDQAMPNLHLPAMTDDIVITPEHVTTDVQTGYAGHRIHVSPSPGDGWQWAHLLRAVSGWEVIAAGVLAHGQYDTAAKASAEIVRRFRGARGDGYDHLLANRFTQIGGSTIACILREESTSTYCGDIGGREAVFDTEVHRHAEQHCIHCNAAYRAANYGRMAQPR